MEESGMQSHPRNPFVNTQVKRNRHTNQQRNCLGGTSDSFLSLKQPPFNSSPILTHLCHCLPFHSKLKPKPLTRLTIQHTSRLPSRFDCVSYLSFAHSDHPSCHDFLASTSLLQCLQYLLDIFLACSLNKRKVLNEFLWLH